MSDDSGSSRSADLDEPVPASASASSPPAAEEPESASGRARLDRRVLLGAGAAVTVLVLVLAFLLSREPEGPGAREDLNVGTLATPKAVRDLVPQGPIITTYPAACGVPDDTARDLVRGSEPGGRESSPFADTSEGHCMWYALNEGDEKGGIVPDSDRLRKERVLTVDISLSEATSQGSAIGRAIWETHREPVGAGARAVRRTVTGLGEEAWASYSPALDVGAFVRFRVGNANVSVTYDGWDRTGKDPVRRQIPEQAAVDGALTAAAGIAKNLGVPTPASPGFARPQATSPPIRRLPKPCDTVTDETLRKVANGAYRERGGSASIFAPAGGTTIVGAAGTAEDTCEWTAGTPTGDTLEAKDSGRHLTVVIAMATDPHPGAATHIATREYVMRHHDARGGQRFMPVGGLGDQAFTAYGNASGGGSELAGRVVFRLRNVLVVVRYHANSDDDDPLTPNEAVNGAYTVALDVARSLPRP
jgi:hypothetical protein